jgi:CheY-like chemotaxis protein
MSVATPRVLVVSESRITRRVVEMTFADQPLQLAVFADGAAAVDDWQTRPPAVLIADIAMGPPDGYAVATTLREQPAGQKACVILLAGQADVVDQPAVAAVRASSVLRKPLDSHQLIDAVRQALRTGPPAEAPAPQPVAVAVAAGGGAAVAVAERDPAPAIAAGIAAADVALLLGRESALDGDRTIGAWVQEAAGGRPDDGLADTFHAMLEVEQTPRPPASSAAAAVLGDADIERIAHRVAALVTTDQALRAQAVAALAERAAADAAAAARQAAERLAPELVAAAAAEFVRSIAPALVHEIAHAAVRDEIARLRAARG